MSKENFLELQQQNSEMGKLNTKMDSFVKDIETLTSKNEIALTGPKVTYFSFNNNFNSNSNSSGERYYFYS